MTDTPPISGALPAAASALSPPSWDDDPRLTAQIRDAAVFDADDYRAIQWIEGDGRLPVVLSCPHAGRDYPQAMLEAATCTLEAMRGLEDFGVDQLLPGIAAEGVCCIVNHVGRAYCDVNRSADALDPAMFDGPVAAGSASRHVKAGYGILPKLTAERTPIYARRLAASEAATRIARVHTPYHGLLRAQMTRTEQQLARAILLDLHSMPAHDRLGRSLPDIVLGDCLGTTLNRQVANHIEQYFTERALSVVWNHPYAGGYITRHSGRQNTSRQSMQIEINRSLYMKSARQEMDPEGTARMTEILHGFAIHLSNMCDAGHL